MLCLLLVQISLKRISLRSFVITLIAIRHYLVVPEGGGLFDIHFGWIRVNRGNLGQFCHF